MGISFCAIVIVRTDGTHRKPDAYSTPKMPFRVANQFCFPWLIFILHSAESLQSL